METVYIYTTTSSNSQYAYTVLDNSYLNGNPTSQVFVTQRWFSSCYLLGCGISALNNSPVSVFYQPFLHRWCIYNNTGANMPTDALFNVIS